MEDLPLPPATFATPRLDLHRLVHADLDRLATIYASPAVARHLFDGAPSLERTCQELAAFERHWQQHGYGQSAIIERATGDFIGRVGLHVHEPWDDVELHVVITRDRQRRGYATEAARPWLDWAHAQGVAERLVVVAPARNAAALGTARSLGFHPTPDRPTPWSGARIVLRLDPSAMIASQGHAGPIAGPRRQTTSPQPRDAEC